MLIAMKVQISGTRDGADWPAPGGTIDLPDDEATQLIGLGLAEAAPAPEADTPKGRKGE